jgi:hypothetical protein
MTDPQNPPLDTIDEIYTNPDPPLDFVRLQIGFWEKVVVLDAATLAASFTAIAMFRANSFGDSGVGYLEAAWKLLFSGIALCLLAQWLAIPGIIAISGHNYAMRILSLLNRTSVEKAGFFRLQEYKQIESAIVAEAPWLDAKGRYLSRTAGALGSLGLFASIGAFYWLYRFAQVNVSRLAR